MTKAHVEILLSIVFVVGGTAVMYSLLAHEENFWNAQRGWSLALIIGYAVLSFEYFRQGWIIHHAHSGANLSPILATSVMVMQCILFVKGVFFEDWSLVVGALVVNCGVVFYLYQIVKTSEHFRSLRRRR